MTYAIWRSTAKADYSDIEQVEVGRRNSEEDALGRARELTVEAQETLAGEFQEIGGVGFRLWDHERGIASVVYTVFPE